MDIKLKQLLTASFDRELSPAEKAELEPALATSTELKDEKMRLMKLRRAIQEQPYKFRESIVGEVMKLITKEKEQYLSGSLVYAFNRIALPLLAAASILLLFWLFSEGGISADSILGTKDLEPQYLSEFLLFNY
ncbi:MAG: hypothetical protein EOM06_02100 [Sphingobacteriia bacterium]|nr:hypothetical protein [Sphingobacteriia bacterium]